MVQDLLMKFNYLSASRSHDPARVTDVWSRDRHHREHDLLRLWSCEPTEPELPVRSHITHSTVVVYNDIKHDDDNL